MRAGAGSILMKKYTSLFILLAICFNSAVFATGLQTPPQLENSKKTPTQMQKSSPALQNSEKTLNKIEDSGRDNFTPLIDPAQKFDPKKPISVGTYEESKNYVKISLPEAIDYAMQHNLDIISTRLNVPMARNDIKTANRLRNPYIQFFLNSGKAATDNPNNTGLIFPIEIAKRGPRKNLAKSTYELVKGNVLLAELNLRLDVRQSYVDLVSAKSTLEILSEQRQLVQELVNIAQKKYNVGAVPQMDVIQSKMALNQILIQENSAKTDVLVYRHKFNLLLEAQNFDTKEDYLPEQNEFIALLTPNSTAKVPDFETLYSIAMTKRLDIKNAKQDIDVAQKNLVTVVRQRVPDIEIGGGPIFVPQQWSTSEQTTYGAYIGGNITNIPLLYLYNPEIKNAKLQIEQKELDYKSVQHQAKMNLQSAYDTFIMTQMNLNHYNDILLSESRQFLNMAKKSYIVGKSSLTDLIFIEQNYKSIMMGYVNALSDYYDAWIDILREVNDENISEELKLNG